MANYGLTIYQRIRDTLFMDWVNPRRRRIISMKAWSGARR